MNITKGFFLAIAVLGLVNVVALEVVDRKDQDDTETRRRLVCNGKTIAETSDRITLGSSEHYSADNWDYWPNHGEFCTITMFEAPKTTGERKQ